MGCVFQEEWGGRERMEAVTNVTLFLSSGAKGLGKLVLEQQG